MQCLVCFITVTVRNLGLLYVGAMVTEQGVKVLEYNCRFGDPETQVLMRILQTDLYDVMYACCFSRLNEIHLSFLSDFACAVVLANEGYPAKVVKGGVISGTDETVKDSDIKNVQIS